MRIFSPYKSFFDELLCRLERPHALAPTHTHSHALAPTHPFTHTNSLPRPFGTTVSKLQRRKEEKPILISRTWTPFLHFLDYYI